MSEETKQEIIFWVTALLMTACVIALIGELSGATDIFINSFEN